jgi:hypothetical protein
MEVCGLSGSMKHAWKNHEKSLTGCGKNVYVNVWWECPPFAAVGIAGRLHHGHDLATIEVQA